MRLWRKIEAESYTAIANLPSSEPSSEPWRDAAGRYHKGSRFLAAALAYNLAYVQTKFGEYYEGGIGVQKNYTEAVNWYVKAIQTYAAWVPAKVDLGRLYAYGWGVPQDRVKARQLWVEAGATAVDLVQLLDNDALPRDIQPGWRREDNVRFWQEVKAAVAKLNEDEERKRATAEREVEREAERQRQEAERQRQQAVAAIAAEFAEELALAM